MKWWTLVVTAVGVLVALLAWQFPRSEVGGASEAPPSVDTSTATVASATTSLSDPTPSRDEPPTQPRTTTLIGVPDEITVNIELTDGGKVGPNIFQLSPYGNVPQALVRYGWQSRSEGVPVGSDNCQIHVTVAGPQVQPGLRSANCSQEFKSTFNSQGTQLRVTAPGSYTIIAREGISGAEGKQSFRVVG